MNENVQLVIFDLDGTLVDAFKAVSDSVNHALESMGYDPLGFDDIKKNVGWGERVLISQFVKKEDIDKTLSVFRQHHRFALKTGVKFLPGAKDLIKHLKAEGYHLAIASNRPTRFTHIILKQLHVLETFDYILCGDKVDHPKPSGEILTKVVAKFSLKTTNALYIGDMAIDIEAGADAGVKTVAVTTGSHTREHMQTFNPHAIVNHLNEVPKMLENGL